MSKILNSAFRFTGGLLIVLGIAKIIGSVADNSLLDNTDDVFGMRFRLLFLAVGAVEIGIGILCSFAQSPFLRAVSVAWLATSYLIYRLALSWIAPGSECHCHGSLVDMLPLAPVTLERITKAILIYLGILGYGAIFYCFRKAPQ